MSKAPQLPKQSIRAEVNRIIDEALKQIRPVIKPENGTGVMGIMSASDLLRMDILDLLVSELEAVAAEMPDYQDEYPVDTETGAAVETYGYEATYNAVLKKAHQVINRKVREIEG